MSFRSFVFLSHCFNNRVMLLKLMRTAECGKRGVRKTISVEHEECGKRRVLRPRDNEVLDDNTH